MITSGRALEMSGGHRQRFMKRKSRVETRTNPYLPPPWHGEDK